MISIVESPGFARAYKRQIKNNPVLRERFKEKVTQFIADPNHPSLRTHKLSGKLKDSWAFSVAPDLRIVFSYVRSDVVLFEDFGSHDEVY
jgi:addiction module RelE/StbE family toxin